jgi:hypothetical protein
MLDAIRADHFEPLVGRSLEVAPENGAPVPLTIESVHRHPNGRFPDDSPETREPFSVILRGQVDVPLVDEACALLIPELGRLHGVRVSRIAPLSRDPNAAFFQILFN